MEQWPPTNAPGRRKDNSDTTPDRSFAKSTHNTNAPQVLARSSPLATLTMDLPTYHSRLKRVQVELGRHTAPRRNHYAHAEHILPLVRWAPELPWCEVCPGGIRGSHGVLSTQPPCRDCSWTCRELGESERSSVSYDGRLRHGIALADAQCG